MREEVDAKTGNVRSVLRALSILKCLGAARVGLGLSEIAAQSGLAPSTVHRILTTLETERFVRFDGASGVWQVGVEAFSVGSAFLRGRDIVAIARPYLRQLRDECGETTNLYLEAGGEIICMDQAESRRMMRTTTRIGSRALMHYAAAGKAYLAAVSEARREAILAQKGMPAMTSATLVTPEQMRTECDRIRRQGYALDTGECEEGLHCLGVALCDEAGRPVAGLSISGPSVRLTRSRLPDLQARLQTTAAEITAAFGGVGAIAAER